jgi:hypothetical protein
VVYVGIIPFFGIPPASGLLGHSLGIFGFLLMLSTETLYSLRKRYTRARFGKLSTWLSVHIFTGLVGPYLVLLHSSWKFNGLAGIVMLLTIIIVISGFVGRYFYTAVPRSADGAVLELSSLTEMEAKVQAELRDKASAHPEFAKLVEDLLSSGAGEKQARRLRQEWASAEQRLPAPLQEDWKRLRALGERQLQIKKQLAGLSSARRLLAIWHTVHIPIGVVLFALAFIHIFATLYFVTLAR